MQVHLSNTIQKFVRMIGYMHVHFMNIVNLNVHVSGWPTIKWKKIPGFSTDFSAPNPGFFQGICPKLGMPNVNKKAKQYNATVVLNTDK